MSNEGMNQMDLKYQETYAKAYRTRNFAYKRLQKSLRIVATVAFLLAISCASGFVTYAALLRSNSPELAADAIIKSNKSETVSEDSTASENQNDLTDKDTSSYNGSVPRVMTKPPEVVATNTQQPTPKHMLSVRSVSMSNEGETTVVNDEEIPLSTMKKSKTPSTFDDGIADLTKEEIAFVEKVVEAEVTGTTYNFKGEDVDEEEMLKCKLRVAQVFLNRAKDNERFSHVGNLYEAVVDPGASSTTVDGRCYKVEVTNLTKEAVALAMDPKTEDLTQGALFFLAYGQTENQYGDYLFTDEVGHSFFK